MSVQARWLLGIAVIWVSLLSGDRALAQITPDRTLPNNSIVTPNGSTFNITGGTQAGRNLFHSFQQFSLPTGGTASFNHGLDIQNIFTRVTGGSVSNIDGIIQAYGTANVFFLNPSGIVFGKNASLNVGGSFVATTANAIQFGNQGTFSASVPNNPALLTINPSALFYNQIVRNSSIQNSSIVPAGVNPNSSDGGQPTAPPLIASNGLRVPDGKSLLLVGGDITMDGGGLRAYGGRIELGAIAGAGTVDLNFVNNQWRLSIPDSVPRGDISLINGASVDVTGNGSGSVAVTAHNLEILGGSSIYAGLGLKSMADSSPPGDITLNTTGLVTIMNPSTVINQVEVTTDNLDPDHIRKGDAGDINIIAGDIYIDNRNNSTYNPDYSPGDYIPAALQASSGGMGRAGNVSLSATGSINLIGQALNDNANLINTYFSTSSVPGGGDITLKANGSISLNNAYLTSARGNGSGNISLFGKESVSITDNSFLDAGAINGNSGNITVQSNGPVSIDRSSLGINVGLGSAGGGIPGNGGDINISGRSISITSGSLLESSAEEEAINSGNISLNATDRIEISGYDPFYNPECCTGNHNRPFVYTTLRTSSLPNSLGQAGAINVNTPTLGVSDGAILRADSQNVLKGGNINVNANVVELINGGQLFTNASSTGNAGNINLKNTERLVIDGINPTFDKFNQIAQAFVPMNDSSAQYQLYPSGIVVPTSSGIFASTKSSLGGNITIDAPKLLLLRHNGQISASAGTEDSSGNGGNITINAPNGFIVAALGENSDITANAFFGSGGKIQIKALGIYNFNEPTLKDLETLLGTKDPNKLNLYLQQTPTNNITAISLTSPTLSGSVNIITPDIDTNRSLVTLPTVRENTPKLISSNCAAFNETAGGSNFTATGRGGIPPSPFDPLDSDVTWTDNRLSAIPKPLVRTEKPSAKQQPQAKIPEIQPATGWVFIGNGEVTLISNVHGLAPTSTNCSKH